MSLYSLKRGKELEDDEEYQERLKDPVWREKILNTTATSLDEVLPTSARNSVLLFILSILVIDLVRLQTTLALRSFKTSNISRSEDDKVAGNK